ncbi:ComEC/Rec2 family competence protein [Salinibacterium sp. ZJ77]|uniref:ComEC/Rec2 family competence protein n=1 Tax=Salinibacterium sp. ZJ77 TaxID=2708337 RepID=UPI0014236F7A|nr:ComEC/Rec2 family competence protein [Salinibacterium sp. ZJ77]
MTESRRTTLRELRLAPAALGAWAAAGILVGLAPDAPFGAIASVLWAGAALSALCAARGPVWLAITLCLTAAALSATGVAIRAPDRLPAAFAQATQHPAPVELHATITGQVRDGRVAAIAQIAESAEEGSVHALLFLPADGGDREAIEPRIGEIWAVSARLRAAEPGDSITVLAFADEPGERLGRAPPVLAAAADLRAGLRELASALPGRGAQLLPGLAVGDTSRVDEGLHADMKISSLSHLTAVSGANCAIVVGAVFAIAAALGTPRGVRVGAALLALIGFVVLVTPEPSVLRASVMAGVVLIGLASGRPMRGVPALALAVVVLLVVDPWTARSYGFALSVLATAGLLLLASPLASLLARWVPAPLALVVAIPLAAQLACQPVLVLLSPTIAGWGVLANVLAGPAAPLATVLGLIACLLAPVAPPIAVALAAIAWLPATWVASVATLGADLPGARLPWLDGAAGLVSLAALTALGLVAAFAPQGSRWRRASSIVVLTGLVAAGTTPALVRLADTLSRPSDWQFAMCDVGQGDALVVRSATRIMLVDTGPDPDALAGCLDDLGIVRIDVLVVTHYDADHVGGLAAVTGRVDLALVAPVHGPDDERHLDALVAEGAAVRVASVGQTGTLGEHHWKVLWPLPRGSDTGNDASVIIHLQPDTGCASCLSALLLGDLGEEAQIRMAARHPSLAVDVLKVAHHGSGDTSASLIGRAQAAIGLIGVSADNSYGHPHPRALDALSVAGTAVLRTDRDGLILVAPSGVWTEHAPAAPASDVGAAQ